MTEVPTLRVDFTFDPGSGLFYGTLENGTRFAVDRRNLAGKLAANLDLFRGAVVREKKGENPRPPLPTRDEAAIAEAIAAGKVRKYDKAGRPALTLEDLDLSLEGLEL